MGNSEYSRLCTSHLDGTIYLNSTLNNHLIENGAEICSITKRAVEERWHALRLIFVLGFVSIASDAVTAAPDRPLVMTGEGDIRVYSQAGGLKFEDRVTFDFAKDGNRYAVRALILERELERRLFVTSDSKSVYQADTIVRPGRNYGSKPTAFATFESGNMPGRVGLGGWIVPQTLVLAMHLVNKSRTADTTTLSDGEIPEFFERRASELRMDMKTKLVQRGSDLRVEFWATRRGAANVVLENGTRDAFLVGLMKIESHSHGLPTKLRIQNNRAIPDENGTLQSAILSDITLEGQISEGNPAGIFNRVAYDADVRAGVNDNRFGSGRFGYTLFPRDPLPFEGSLKFHEIERMYVRNRSERDQALRKRIVVIGACSLSLVALALFLFRNLNVDQNYEYTHKAS